MASIPGEASGFSFDFGPERSFDQIEVAQRLIWPLVDVYWQGDWREQSKVGHEMRIPRSGMFNGQNYDVALTAFSQYLLEEEDEESGIPILSSAVLEVEPIVTDERKDMIIAKAQQDDAERFEEMDEEDLVAKISTSYSFDTDDDMEIETCQAVEDIEGEHVWMSESSSYIDVPSDQDTENEVIISMRTPSTLLEHDMELIEAGLYILRAPKSIMKALAIIKTAN